MTLSIRSHSNLYLHQIRPISRSRNLFSIRFDNRSKVTKHSLFFISIILLEFFGSSSFDSSIFHPIGLFTAIELSSLQKLILTHPILCLPTPKRHPPKHLFCLHSSSLSRT